MPGFQKSIVFKICTHSDLQIILKFDIPRPQDLSLSFCKNMPSIKSLKTGLLTYVMSACGTILASIYLNNPMIALSLYGVFRMIVFFFIGGFF